MIREGQYASARVKIDAALAANAKNPQARFLRGVVQADQDQADEAVATFQALTEDFPELPEPYNNLAVIWAQRGQYEKARTALESAIAPVYSRIPSTLISSRTLSPTNGSPKVLP